MAEVARDRFVKATSIHVLEQSFRFVKAGRTDRVIIDRQPAARVFDHACGPEDRQDRRQVRVEVDAWQGRHGHRIREPFDHR